MNLITVKLGSGLTESSSTTNSTRLYGSIQLSYQKKISLPFPIFHIIPFLSSCWQFTTLSQTCESICLLVHVRKSWVFKYFAHITLTQILSSLIRIFHANLHWKDFINCFWFFKTKRSLGFGHTNLIPCNEVHPLFRITVFPKEILTNSIQLHG